VVAIIHIAESLNVMSLDVIDRLTNQKIESIRKAGRSHQGEVGLKEISGDEDWRKKYIRARFTVPWFVPVPRHAGTGHPAGQQNWSGYSDHSPL
jgi:hypothetical protein